MTRNLEYRVETLVPITEATLQAELRELIDLQLSDRRGAWELDKDGVYHRRTPEPDSVHSQLAMVEKAIRQLPPAALPDLGEASW